MKDIAKFVTDKSKKDNMNDSQLISYLENPKLGLLVNERYLNLPQPLIPM